MFSLYLRFHRDITLEDNDLDSKWIAWTLLLLFLFFTLSGSRRSYYVLPMVPFAILFSADWILSAAAAWRAWAARLVVLSFVLLLLGLAVLPAWYYAQFGVNRFAMLLKDQAEQVQPWANWNIVMLDAESKLNFYLHLPPDVKNYQVKGSERHQQTPDDLVQMWPILANKPANTIFISRKLYLEPLQRFFPGYRVVELPAQASVFFLQKHDINVPVAFIPNQ